MVVSWNSAQVIESCLHSANAAHPTEIVVVDNHSLDQTVSMVRQSFPSVRIIPLAYNSGFAHACNVGVACTQAPYVLFLNDDASLAPSYLTQLWQALEARPDAASATGKLLRPVGAGSAAVIDSAGLELLKFALRPQDRGQGQPDCGQYDQAEDIFGPSGAAALYRRAAFGHSDNGPFDTSFFAYYEDVDLAWRLANLGWRHLYVPTAQARHGRRGPTDKPAPIQARAFINRYRTWIKNEAPLNFAAYAPLALAWELGRLARLGVARPALLRHMARDLAHRWLSF